MRRRTSTPADRSRLGPSCWGDRRRAQGHATRTSPGERHRATTGCRGTTGAGRTCGSAPSPESPGGCGRGHRPPVRRGKRGHRRPGRCRSSRRRHIRSRAWANGTRGIATVRQHPATAGSSTADGYLRGLPRHPHPYRGRISDRSGTRRRIATKGRFWASGDHRWSVRPGEGLHCPGDNRHHLGVGP